eukprot:UN26726
MRKKEKVISVQNKSETHMMKNVNDKPDFKFFTLFHNLENHKIKEKEELEQYKTESISIDKVKQHLKEKLNLKFQTNYQHHHSLCHQ